MTHRNASLIPEGKRRLAVLVVDVSWSCRRAAERFQVAPVTAANWAARYRAGEPLTDRSSRPGQHTMRLAPERQAEIFRVRRTRHWGPYRIAAHLGIPRSTVGRVLARYHMPLPKHLDR